MSVYYVFAIKCTKDNSYYLGVSSKASANTMSFMIDTYRKDKTKYVKFNEAIIKHGRNNFIQSRIGSTFPTKEDAEKYVYDTLVKLGDRVLNDKVISPVRVECPDCHKKIREEFLDVHVEKYCVHKAFEELIPVLSEAPTH